MSIRPLCIVPGEGSRRIQIGAYLSATHLPYAYRVSPDGEDWGPWWPYKVHQEEIAHLVVLAARPFDQAARILELEAALVVLTEAAMTNPSRTRKLEAAIQGARATLRGETDAE
jgi:hypothetical protein